MGFTNLVIDVNPNATAYDEDYPTRSTELLNHQLHEMLVDMNDATGSWYFTDNTPSSTELSTYREAICAIIEDVFDYAESAITAHRNENPIPLAKPTHSSLYAITSVYAYPSIMDSYARVYEEAYKFMWFIYYMWKTEEDPLLLKEKLQELLIAWPLMDTTIDLQTESGQTIRMYPSWKNVDLDL